MMSQPGAPASRRVHPGAELSPLTLLLERTRLKPTTHAAGVLSCFNCVCLFVALWAAVRQAPLSKGFSRQEYWSRLPCPPPGNLPDPGIKPHLLGLLL